MADIAELSGSKQERWLFTYDPKERFDLRCYEEPLSKVRQPLATSLPLPSPLLRSRAKLKSSGNCELVGRVQASDCGLLHTVSTLRPIDFAFR
jgi:hypothetical protein